MWQVALVEELDLKLVSISHIFPQGVLSPITLLCAGAGGEWDRAIATCEPGLLLYSVPIAALSGEGVGTEGLEQNP